jgi:predicted nuclease of predicted toxin-antitoxin system
MRFLVDECTGPAVARWLKEQGHNVFSVYEQARGLEDDEIVERAYKENRILITNDKDFGEKVYRDKKPHRGIILLRLDDERAHNKIKVIQQLLENFPGKLKLKDNFLVVTEQRVRLARK